MSEYGPPCVKCGHPPSYHGMTWCVHPSGGAVKRDCDCDGYVPMRDVIEQAGSDDNPFGLLICECGHAHELIDRPGGGMYWRVCTECDCATMRPDLRMPDA